MEFQANIIKFIQSFSSPVLDYFFIFITNLGGEGFYFLLIPVFYWSINKKMGLKLGSALLLSIYLNVVIKEVTAVPRPIGYPGIRAIFTSSAGGYSFPSGHAQGSTTIWGIIMAHYKNAPVYILGIGIITLVSLSRLYLGVHWPLDIIWGIGLGSIMVFITFYAARFNPPKSFWARCTLALAFPLILLALFPHPDAFKHMGMLSSVWLGYLLEVRFVNYEPQKTTTLKAVEKYAIGAIGFILIYGGLKFLPASNISYLVRYFLLGLWLTLGAPFLFNSFKI